MISIKWILPGTVLVADTTQDDAADRIFTPMFLTGGLVLSQVAQITGLESYTIQNWVKRGFLAPPQNKKYTRRQLSRIILINMLKSAIPMEQICRLLSYVNGQLDDESDDIIDDSHLYQYFLLLAARAKAGELHSAENRLDGLLSAAGSRCPVISASLVRGSLNFSLTKGVTHVKGMDV